MGTFEPQDTLVLVGLTAAIILLIAIAVMAVARRSRGSTAPRTSPVRTPEFGSVKRSDSPATVSSAVPTPAAPTPVAPPTRLAVPQAPPSAPQPSYTAVAVAQTHAFAAGRADPPPRTVIDYSEAMINIGPNASYTAAAIAALLGQAANTNTPPGAPSSSTSYAAVAAATAESAKPRSASSPAPRIDYSGEASTIPPNASYTAIAVAVAMQPH